MEGNQLVGMSEQWKNVATMLDIKLDFYCCDNLPGQLLQIQSHTHARTHTHTSTYNYIKIKDLKGK